jgi:hypothetical protein
MKLLTAAKPHPPIRLQSVLPGCTCCWLYGMSILHVCTLYCVSVLHGRTAWLPVLQVYCLPDNYEVVDRSLDDIRAVLNPSFTPEVGSTYAVHMQYLCSTCAVLWQYICSTDRCLTHALVWLCALDDIRAVLNPSFTPEVGRTYAVQLYSTMSCAVNPAHRPQCMPKLSFGSSTLLPSVHLRT